MDVERQQIDWAIACPWDEPSVKKTQLRVAGKALAAEVLRLRAEQNKGLELLQGIADYCGSIHPIDELPLDGFAVFAMRRTGQETLKVALIRPAPGAPYRGWYAARPPTHWCYLDAIPLTSAPPSASRAPEGNDNVG